MQWVENIGAESLRHARLEAGAIAPLQKIEEEFVALAAAQRLQDSLEHLVQPARFVRVGTRLLTLALWVLQVWPAFANGIEHLLEILGLRTLQPQILLLRGLLPHRLIVWASNLQ